MGGTWAIFLILSVAVGAWLLYIHTAGKKENLKKHEKVMNDPEFAKLVRSYIDEDTGTMFLRSFDYPDNNSEEWIISSKSVTITKVTLPPSTNSTSKAIPISQIAYVELKPDEQMKVGTLGLRISGVATRQSFGTTSSDTSLVAIGFHHYDLEVAKKIHDYLTERTSQGSLSSSELPETPPTLCELDQLAKLKALLDDGAIDENEFERLKKDLIG